MSNLTDRYIKHGTVLAVIQNLNQRKFKLDRIEYLESIKDIDKAYIIANRYIRNYIRTNDKKENDAFIKEIYRLGSKWRDNGGKWLKEDLVIETDKSKKVSTIELEELTSEQKDEVLTELVHESNDEFIHSIESADNSIHNQVNVKTLVIEEKNKPITSGIELIKLAIEKGVTKFSEKFLEYVGIDRVLVGYKDDVALYYCENVNGIFEVIK